MKKKAVHFTFVQMMAFHAFNRVLESGEFNMFDPRAQIKSGLSDKDYLFVMDNYSAMRAQEQQEEIRDIAMATTMAERFDIHF